MCLLGHHARYLDELRCVSYMQREGKTDRRSLFCKEEILNWVSVVRDDFLLQVRAS